MENNGRLRSLDTLRGFDMLFIMGLANLVMSVCALFPEGNSCWLATQMTHVDWEGLHHHDTIFPLFLFIAGMTFPFSYAKQVEKGKPQWKIILKCVCRALMLAFLGLVVNGFFKFDFAHLRIGSVLGRIGFAWMFAALMYMWLKPSVRAILCVAFLVGSYLLIRFIPAPDMPTGTDPLSLQGNLAGYIDRMFFPMPQSFLYPGVYEADGILTTFPAIVTASLGMFTGAFVRRPDTQISGNRKTGYMLIAAAILLGIGLLWNMDYPCNKKMWNSTFVVLTAAYSLFCFAVFYWIIDVKGWKRWTTFFEIVGMNSITIYMAQCFIGFKNISNFFFHGVADLAGAAWGRIICDFGYLTVCWLFLYFLYRKKIFIKI